MKAKEGKEKVEGSSHHKGRRDDSYTGKEGDQPHLILEVAQVDMESARKEQKAEHPLHESGVKVDALDKFIGCGRDDGDEVAEEDKDDAEEEPDQHNTNRSRELDEAVVYVGKEGRQSEKHGRGIEKIHLGERLGKGRINPKSES